MAAMIPGGKRQISISEPTAFQLFTAIKESPHLKHNFSFVRSWVFLSQHFLHRTDVRCGKFSAQEQSFFGVSREAPAFELGLDEVKPSEPDG